MSNESKKSDVQKVVTLAIGITLSVRTAHADPNGGIVLDGSLHSSQANQVISESGSSASVTITKTMGVQRGGTLFHSFDRFNVNTGQTVTFDAKTSGSGTSIGNVVSRVTGGTRSDINGKLSVDHDPGVKTNFFLLNPAGVVIGNGAVIDVPGTFHVSNATSLSVGNGQVFHSDNTSLSNQIRVAEPSEFGFTQSSPATNSLITVDNASVAVSNGAALDVVANKVEVKNNSALSADRGAIRIVAVGNNGDSTVSVDVKAAPSAPGGTVAISGSSLSVANSSGYIGLHGGDVAVDSSTVTARNTGNTSDAGIRVSGSNLGVRDGAKVATESSTADGGAVTIDSQTVEVTGNSSIESLASGSRSGGHIDINGTSTTVGTAGLGTDKSSISSSGRGGRITVTDAADVTVAGGGRLSTDNSGEVSVTAGSIALQDDGAIRSDASASGSTGGKVSVKTTQGNVTLAGTSQISSGATGSADAGDVEVDSADGINVPVGASIYSDTSGGNGQSGTVAVKTGSNLTIDSSSSPIYSRGKTGKAGRVSLTAPTIRLTGKAGATAPAETGSRHGVQFGDSAITVAGTDLHARATDGTPGTVTVDFPDLAANANVDVKEGSTVTAAKWESIAPNSALVTMVSGGSTIADINSQGLEVDAGGGTLKLADTGKIGVTHGRLKIANARQISVTDAGSRITGSVGSMNVAASSIEVTNGGSIESSSSADASIAGTTALTVSGEGATIVNKGRGAMDVTAPGVEVKGGGSIQTSSGKLTINGGNSVTVSGNNSVISNSGSAETEVKAPAVTIENGGSIETTSASGQLKVTGATSVNVSGADATIATKGGSRLLVAAPFVEVKGGGAIKSTGSGKASIDATGKIAVHDASSTIVTSGTDGSLELNANDVEVSNGGAIRSTDAGGIVKVVAANTIVVADTGSVIATNGTGGSIDLTAPTASVLNGGRIQTVDSGLLNINAGQSLVVGANSAVESSSTGSRRGGDIRINGDQSVPGMVDLIAGGKVVSLASATGDGGDVMIRASDVKFGAGAEIGTSSSSSKAGNVTLSVANEVALAGGVIRSVAIDSGKSGDVNVFSDKDVTIDSANNAIYSSAGSGKTNAGAVNISAPTIRIVGGANGQLPADVGNMHGIFFDGNKVIANGVGLNGSSGGLVLNGAAGMTEATFGDGSVLSLPSFALEGASAGSKVTITGGSTMTDRDDGKGLGVNVGPASLVLTNGGGIVVDHGALSVQGGAIALSGEGTRIASNTANSSARIVASTITLGNDANVVSSNGASLAVNANQSLVIESGARLAALGVGAVEAGPVSINDQTLQQPGDVTIRNGGTVASNGEMTIRANTLTLNGNTSVRTGIVSNPLASGSPDSGVVIESAQVTANEVKLNTAASAAATISNGASVTTGMLTSDASSLTVTGQGTVVANAGPGALTVSTTNLNVDEGGTISSVDAGDILIKAQNIQISGNGSVYSQTTKSANGGNVVVAQDIVPTGGKNKIQTPADSIQLSSGGKIYSWTTGPGTSGNVSVSAKTITLDKGFIATTNNSNPFGWLSANTAQAVPQGGTVGRSGNLDVHAQKLVLQNGGQIFTETARRGVSGGRLYINGTATAPDFSPSSPHTITVGPTPGTGIVTKSTGSGGKAGDLYVWATRINDKQANSQSGIVSPLFRGQPPLYSGAERPASLADNVCINGNCDHSISSRMILLPSLLPTPTFDTVSLSSDSCQIGSDSSLSVEGNGGLRREDEDLLVY